jgi:hypothetical protein
LTQCRSSIQPANTTQGIRGAVTWTVALPSRQISPTIAPVTSTPMVVMFSPNMPLVTSRPSCSTHQSRSSLA